MRNTMRPVRCGTELHKGNPYSRIIQGFLVVLQ